MHSSVHDAGSMLLLKLRFTSKAWAAPLLKSDALTSVKLKASVFQLR